MQCGKKLKSTISLQRHMKGHLRIFDYKCENFSVSKLNKSKLGLYEILRHDPKVDVSIFVFLVRKFIIVSLSYELLAANFLFALSV